MSVSTWRNLSARFSLSARATTSKKSCLSVDASVKTKPSIIHHNIIGVVFFFNSSYIILRTQYSLSFISGRYFVIKTWYKSNTQLWKPESWANKFKCQSVNEKKKKISRMLESCNTAVIKSSAQYNLCAIEIKHVHGFITFLTYNCCPRNGWIAWLF